MTTIKSKFRGLFIAQLVVFMAFIIAAFLYISYISVYAHGMFSAKSIIWYVALIAGFFLVRILSSKLLTIEVHDRKIILRNPFGKTDEIQISSITSMRTFKNRWSASSSDLGVEIIDPHQSLAFSTADDVFEIPGNTYSNYEEMKKAIKKSRAAI